MRYGITRTLCCHRILTRELMQGSGLTSLTKRFLVLRERYGPRREKSKRQERKSSSRSCRFCKENLEKRLILEVRLLVMLMWLSFQFTVGSMPLRPAEILR